MFASSTLNGAKSKRPCDVSLNISPPLEFGGNDEILRVAMPQNNEYIRFCIPLFVRFETILFLFASKECVSLSEWLKVYGPFTNHFRGFFPVHLWWYPFLFSYIPHISFRHCLSTKKQGATVEGLESPGCSPRARCFDRYWPTCGFLSIMAPKKLLRFRVSKKNSTKLSFDSNLMIVTMFSP